MLPRQSSAEEELARFDKVKLEKNYFSQVLVFGGNLSEYLIYITQCDFHLPGPVPPKVFLFLNCKENTFSCLVLNTSLN